MEAVPREFGSGSSLHRYFQEWVEAGVFWKLWQQGLLEYDDTKGIQWDWQSIDAGKVKSPLGGKKTGNNPTDRSNKGTSGSLITDGSGIPLGIITAGANIHDTKLFEQTLNGLIIDKPEGLHNLLGDKGYDSDSNRHVSWAYEYETHIRSRCKEILRKKKDPKKKNRRWVVERTFSWFNKFRRLYIRWEKKAHNYDALLHLACAIIAFRASGLLG